MGPLVPGTRNTTSDSSTLILDLKDGLKFLNPAHDGIKFLKRLGMQGFTFHNHKFEWTETQLATREETITVTNVATSVAVANAYQYQKNELLRVDDEVMRVVSGTEASAHPDSTHITVSRGASGTTAAAHTAKLMYSIGVAEPEGSDAPYGISNKGSRLYNYDQTLTRGVSLTRHEMRKLSTQAGNGENPMNKEISMRMIELHRELARAVVYGRRYEDTSGAKPIYSMGGFRQFITSHVYNIGGLPTVAAIDLAILEILLSGGDPKIMTMHPKMKQVIDAFDKNLVRIQTGEKDNHVAGNPGSHYWKSGLMDHNIEILADQTFLETEIHIYDTDTVDVGHGAAANGEPGNFHIVDSTPNGADRSDKFIRGDYSIRMETEAANAVLYNLSLS